MINFQELEEVAEFEKRDLNRQNLAKISKKLEYLTLKMKTNRARYRLKKLEHKLKQERLRKELKRFYP